ncbi:hypothetical protein JMV73_01045 [Klebsiella pneumoniae]|nr:hypothetical protein JMV73_01045 [Klebsiella pneumoniae]
MSDAEQNAQTEPPAKPQAWSGIPDGDVDTDNADALPRHAVLDGASSEAIVVAGAAPGMLTKPEGGGKGVGSAGAICNRLGMTTRCRRLAGAGLRFAHQDNGDT